MRSKFLVPFIFCAATITACQTTEPTDKPVTPEPVITNSADAENREFILSLCVAEPQNCNCLADSFIKAYTPKDWEIFRAAMQDQEPPAWASQEDIQATAQKFQEISASCFN